MHTPVSVAAGLMISVAILGGCSPTREAKSPGANRPDAEPVRPPAVTVSEIINGPVAAGTADVEPPAPPRPEELAKLPSADPGWPKAGDKPVYTARTPGGVTIQDFVAGEGMPVLPGALVTLHFSGRVQDGERFQSTWAAGQPETHVLKDFLPGMQEGLVGMRKGGKRRLLIPAAMGFGDRGVSNDKDEIIIPPGSALVFDIELVNLQLTIREAAPAKP